ncbi:serine protease, partial [Pseudonocardia tropica]
MTSEHTQVSSAPVRLAFECGVVAILDGDVPVGTGMLVDSHHVVTCAHVWREAAGRQDARPVTVRFPFAEQVVRPVTLVIERTEGSRYGDIAVLRVEGGAPPGSSAVRLVVPGDVSGHRFEVWGFPRARAGEQFADGRLSRRRGDDLVQMEGDRSTGLSIGPGYSGAPVWDAQLRAVVGIVASVDPDKDAKTGYLIPLDVILRVWPTLRVDAPASVPALWEAPPRIVGLRPSGSLEHWHDRDELRERLADLITGPHRVVGVIGRRGVGKSGVVTKVATDLVESREPGTPSLDCVVYLSTRTGAADLSLDRIVHETSSLLPDIARSQLARRFSATRAAALPALFEALADRAVLIVLDNLDDLQEPQSGAILGVDIPVFLRAVADAPSAPTVITTSQRALRLDVENDVAIVHLELHEGLDPDHAASLLRQMDVDGRAGTGKLDDDALRALSRRVGGVPRGLQLVIAHLRDHPMSGRRRLLRAESAPDELLRQLVSDAFDGLVGATRKAVEAVAVAGVPMSVDALVAVNECPSDEVEDALDELVARRELICGDDGLLRLHPLDTDYVLSRLTSKRRIDLDLRLADWYAESVSDRAGWRQLSDADPVKNEYRHRFRGGEREEALEALAEVADFIVRHGDAEFVRVAVQRAEHDGVSDSAAADVCRGFTELFAGDLATAAAYFRRRSERGGPRGPSGQWEMWSGIALRHMHRPAEAVDVLSPLVADLTVPRLIRFRAAFELGLAHCYNANTEAAADVVLLLVELREPGDSAVVHAWQHNMSALYALVTGDPAAAAAEAEVSAAHYVGTAEADNGNYMHNLRGVALLELGKWDQAFESLSLAADASAAVGQDRPEGLARANLAWANLYLGRWRAAKASAALAVSKLEACGELGSRALVHIGRTVGSDAAETGRILTSLVEELRPNPDIHRPSQKGIAAIEPPRRVGRLDLLRRWSHDTS